MNEVINKADDLDGCLTASDRENIDRMDRLFQEVMSCYSRLAASTRESEKEREEEILIRLFNERGITMQEICGAEKRLHVYSFETPQESHAEASRLIAKLRDLRTENEEFVYYIQRAYEMLFKLAYGGTTGSNKITSSLRRRLTFPFRISLYTRSPTLTTRLKTPLCVSCYVGLCFLQ